jgi:hypothetical protein
VRPGRLQEADRGAGKELDDRAGDTLRAPFV